MKISIFTLALLFIASITLAAGIDGKWEGIMAGGMGGQPTKLSYDFKADGKKLTGTTVDAQGTKIEIKNGKIDGNNISFDVPVDMNGMKLTIAYTGALSGDELKLSFKMKIENGPGGSFSFSSRKSSDPPGGGQIPQIKMEEGPGGNYSFSSTRIGEGGGGMRVPSDGQAPPNEFTVKRIK